MLAVWNVPNLLTAVRVVAAPALAYCLLRGQYTWALYLFVGAAITDALDGWIARHFNQMTHFGAVMDPLADKLITLTCVILLTYQGRVPLWLTLAMVMRDTLIVAGAFAYHRLFGEVDIHPTRLGKLHTLIAFIMFPVTLAQAARLIEAAHWLPALFLLVMVTTLSSAIQYVVLWGKKASHAASRSPEPGQ